MKNIILFLIIFFSVQIVNAQLVVLGQIVDSETKKGISYVTIGVKSTTIGTVSDADGRFALELPTAASKELQIVFSHLNYVDKTVPKSVLGLNGNIIHLEPKRNILREVVVTYKKPKKKKLGRSSKGLGLLHHNFYTVDEQDDDRLSREIGTKFKIKKDQQIADLNFNITSNDYERVTFRLNFYNVKNGMPHSLLNEQDIIFEVCNGYLGWFTLDLKPFEISFSEELEEVICTIQWLESKKLKKEGKYFAISTKIASTKSYFFREKGMAKWENLKAKPSFYLTSTITR